LLRFSHGTMKDLFGQAILDFQTQNAPEALYTETSISDEEALDVAYLFRSYDLMPTLEQKALQLAFGKILDVGCGAGSHALWLQDSRALEVTAIDQSKNAVRACQLRGLKNVLTIDLLDFESREPFDTILLLMNGTGIFQTLDKMPLYLRKLKSLLHPKGQILIDSSDLIYMFEPEDSEDSEGGIWIPGDRYYGELTFTISYKGATENPFPWLYLDFSTLKDMALANGFECELVCEGEHYDYLACLTLG